MIVKGSVRYQKNWLRNDKRTHEMVPKTHIRNVRTGREGSSVVGTVKATCVTGEFSSSSCTSLTSDSDFDGMACDDDDEGILLTSSSFSSLYTEQKQEHKKKMFQNKNKNIKFCWVLKVEKRERDSLRGALISSLDSSMAWFFSLVT